MVELLLASVTAYLGRNKSLPKEAVIFMNSSPGDQVPLYHEFFVNEFNKRIRQTYEDQSILLSVVMINVKTSERFFSDDHGQIKNVQAGTLVGEELVSPNYDFYIVSQQSTRGTTVPNHYRVIYSNSNIEDGELQELAFSQCFNYVNWTGSIKVPAILQYAKKCVKFSSEIMQKNEVPNTL
jgi:aubergine-like protein